MSENTPRQSRVEMTQMILPQFANALGAVFGGQIMAWVDVCAAVAAQRHCRRQVVTASIDAVHFIQPIKQGHVVVLKAQVNAVFHKSMECGISVWSEDPLTGDVKKAVKAYATFVGLDACGDPVNVPSLTLESDEDRRRFTAAQKRREQRLLMRKEML